MRSILYYGLLAATVSAAIVSVNYANDRVRAAYPPSREIVRYIPHSEREAADETIHTMRIVECGYQDNERGEWSYGCWMANDEWWKK